MCVCLCRLCLSALHAGPTCPHTCMQSGKVLRFYAVWDDRGGLYGDRRPYVVHYYLEDDTVEINEVRWRVLWVLF